MTDANSSEEDSLVVTIDRVSGGRNLIARSDSARHILPEEVNGRVPKPGEKWRVKQVHHSAHPIALEPQEHIKTIDDYIPLHKSKAESPEKKEGKGRKKKQNKGTGFETGDFELGEVRSTKKESGTAGTTVKSYTASKNHLLKGNR